MVLRINDLVAGLKKNKIYRAAKKIYQDHYIKNQLASEGEGFICPACKKNWKRFRPFPSKWAAALKNSGWPYVLDDAETLNHKNYTCYGCGITDRGRLYILFFERLIRNEQHYNVVEFAPIPALSTCLRNMPNVTYRTADLFMKGVDDKIDLQDMYLYDNNSFDIFICSHILEHVDDDLKAMKELFRILKPGGTGIAMVPIFESVTETREDPSIKDKNLRLKYFAQADHVRLYAKQDFIQRLESVGFRVKLYGQDYFGESLFEKSGITQKSVLYIVEK